MDKHRKLEFFVYPKGEIKVEDDCGQFKKYDENCHELTESMLELIETQYPTAFGALSVVYEKSKPNRRYYDFLRVHRFIRCNFSLLDQLTWDVDSGGVMHLEDIPCPLKGCGECALENIVCNPRPFGLTARETAVAKLISSGRTYEEVSEELSIAHSTIKNILQKVKEKLKLSSSKDIAKLFVATL